MNKIKIIVSLFIYTTFLSLDAQASRCVCNLEIRGLQDVLRVFVSAPGITFKDCEDHNNEIKRKLNISKININIAQDKSCKIKTSYQTQRYERIIQGKNCDEINTIANNIITHCRIDRYACSEGNSNYSVTSASDGCSTINDESRQNLPVYDFTSSSNNSAGENATSE